MKTPLSDYWLIWLSAIRCPNGVHLSGKTAHVSFMVLWLLPVGGLILAISSALPPIKVIFLAAWSLATIVATYYWVSFLAGASELNRPTCANLVPEFRRRIIQLIRGTWLILTINTTFLIWIGYIFFQKDFYVTVYCWIFLCVGTILSHLGGSTLMAGKSTDYRKQIAKFLLFFIIIPYAFYKLVNAGMGERLLLVLTDEGVLVICSACLIWSSFNKFATMFTSRVREPNLLFQRYQLSHNKLFLLLFVLIIIYAFYNDYGVLVICGAFASLIWRTFNKFATMHSSARNPNLVIQLHHRGQDALETSPEMVPSVADTKKINVNDDAYNQRLESSSTFGEKYILKPLTAFLLCLDQPRETPRNALCLNLLGLSNQTTSVVAEFVYYIYRIIFDSRAMKPGLIPRLVGIGAGIGIIYGIVYLVKMALPYLTPASDGFLIFAPFGLIPIFDVKRYVDRIALTKKEQALVRLSPMVHSLSDLNQMLAQIILRHSFFIWLKWTGVILIAAALLGTPATSLMMQVAFSCMVLPFLGAILVDYAADGQKQFTVVRRWIGLCMALQLVLFIFLFAKARGKTPHIMLWLMGFILPNILLALAIISIRWRKMMAAPIAFPAGRMGAK
jgi:hypothetical protein